MNQCLACQPFCAQCSAMNVCQQCAMDGQLPNLLGTACFACPYVGCTSCSADNVCSSCVDQFFLTAANFCLPCPIGCSECESPGVCTVCLDIGSKPNLAGDACFSCPDPTCSNCDSNGVCSACVGNGVLLPSNTCGACQAFCAECSTTNVCIRCNDPTMRPNFMGTACVPCDIDGCTNCNTAGVCINCDDNRPLVDATTCASCFPECFLCSEQNVCAIC